MAILTTTTQFGTLGLVEEAGAITALHWNAENEGAPTDLLREGIAQLNAYCAGNLQVFDLPLRVAGTAFQQQVCDQIAAIPFGETRTYGDLATALGAPAQAVGQGCGGNPIPILIPCHRVLGANGLGGFSGFGGVEGKIALLKHEGAGSLLI